MGTMVAPTNSPGVNAATAAMMEAELANLDPLTQLRGGTAPQQRATMDRPTARMSNYYENAGGGDRTRALLAAYNPGLGSSRPVPQPAPLRRTHFPLPPKATGLAPLKKRRDGKKMPNDTRLHHNYRPLPLSRHHRGPSPKPSSRLSAPPQPALPAAPGLAKSRFAPEPEVPLPIRRAFRRWEAGCRLMSCGGPEDQAIKVLTVSDGDEGGQTIEFPKGY